MTDDAWRRRRRDEEDDFGPPLFGDESTGEVSKTERELSFDDSDTGPLPHWSEPATGEMPRINPRQVDEPAEDHDVWSSFNDDGPVWSDDAGEATAVHSPVDPLNAADPAGEAADPSFTDYDTTGRDASAPARREPARISIGTDPTGGETRSPTGGSRRRPVDPSRGQRRPAPARRTPPSAGRDMPTAVAVGLALAAIFVGAVMWKAAAVLVIVVLVLGLAAVEFYDKVAEKGYQPATYVGILACVAMPLAAWWMGPLNGPLGLLIVLFLAFAAICATYVSGRDLDTNPLPNTAISTLGVVWIGVMGSFAALILTASKGDVLPIGKDTMFLLVLGVVANDVGAFFAGSTFGKTPLRAWISPNKTIEGFIGGTVFTLVAMGVVGMLDKSDTWNSTGDLLILGVVIAIAAPLGDLTESMFKRNLDIKDFGTLVKGHGGVLDRFDGFLFTLPAVYLLLRTLQPWVS